MPIPAGSTVRYVTAQQVRDVLAPDGSDADGSTAAAMDDAALDGEIAQAADEVDATLSGRYTTPFATVPPLVVSVTRDIAAYLASLTFRKGDPLPQEDPVGLRYARAQKILASIGAGTLTLGSDEPSSGEVAVANPYEGDLFSPGDFGVTRDPFPSRPGYFPSGSWPNGW